MVDDYNYITASYMLLNYNVIKSEKSKNNYEKWSFYCFLF